MKPKQQQQKQNVVPTLKKSSELWPRLILFCIVDRKRITSLWALGNGKPKCSLVICIKASSPLLAFPTSPLQALIVRECKMLYQGWLRSWRCRWRVAVHTAETRRTRTLLIPPSCYCEHFFAAQTKAQSFSYLKTSIIWPPRLCKQPTRFGVLNGYFLYKFPSLIRPWLEISGGLSDKGKQNRRRSSQNGLQNYDLVAS